MNILKNFKCFNNQIRIGFDSFNKKQSNSRYKVTLLVFVSSLGDSSTQCTTERGSTNSGHGMRVASSLAILYFSLEFSHSQSSIVWSKDSPVTRWSSIKQLWLGFFILICGSYLFYFIEYINISWVGEYFHLFKKIEGSLSFRHITLWGCCSYFLSK